MVILVTLCDVVKTTPGLQGGPLTKRLSKGLWRGAVVSSAAVSSATGARPGRRELLTALVKTEGWAWRNVRET